jgi:predicted Zn-dependent protease
MTISAPPSFFCQLLIRSLAFSGKCCQYAIVKNRPLQKYRRYFVVIFLCLVPSLCAHARTSSEDLKFHPEVPLDIHRHLLVRLFPLDRDVQLGLQASQQVKRQKERLPDDDVQNYVGKVGQRLLTALQNSEFHYTFDVIRDRSINAFALPGGPMFIQTGLLTAAANEAQLAGVMGHEIGHVVLRHSTDRIIKSLGVDFLTRFLTAALTQNSSTSRQVAAQMGATLASHLLTLRFSRTDESEADRFGVQLMSRAGYNPAELAKFFQVLQTSPRSPAFLSDHPSPARRIEAIGDEMSQINAGSYQLSNGPSLDWLRGRL